MDQDQHSQQPVISQSQGQNPQGQFSQGQFPQGQYPQGQFPQGQFPQGQFPQGQFPQGQFPQGQYPQGQFPQGQYPQGQFLQGQYFPNGQMPYGNMSNYQQQDLFQENPYQPQSAYNQPDYKNMLPTYDGQNEEKSELNKEQKSTKKTIFHEEKPQNKNKWILPGVFILLGLAIIIVVLLMNKSQTNKPKVADNNVLKENVSEEAIEVKSNQNISNQSVQKGDITVTSKNVIIKNDDNSGLFVAKVENTGDKPLYYDNGKLVIFSDNDDILATEDYVSSSPNDILLQPGEYTYVYEFLWSNPLKNANIGEIKYSVTTDTRGRAYDQLSAVGSLETEVSGSYTYNYVYVTFTNTTKDTLYGVYVVCAIEDEDGNLVYVDRNEYTSLGVHPGSTITLKMRIDSDYIDYYETHNIKLSKIEALVYINGSNQ